MKYSVLLLPLLLSACVSSWDMQGQDPKDFYKENPVENRVETKYETFAVHFMPGADRLTRDDIDDFRGSLRHISSLAAESVQIQVHPQQARSDKRQQHVIKLMRSMGYPEKIILIEPSETVSRDDMQVNVAYASVITPKCPDWRRSPVTTYSNTTQGNIGCSTVTNLGLMVADPRDLVRGNGNVSPDSSRTMTTIQNYRSGATSGAATTSSSGDAGSTATSAATVQ